MSEQRTPVLEPGRQTPVLAEYDVVVLGGGPAGIVAAAAAGRSGRSTLLIERYGFLGGAATAAGVTNFCGLHANVHGEHKRVVHGLASEFIDRIDRLGGLNAQPYLALQLEIGYHNRRNGGHEHDQQHDEQRPAGKMLAETRLRRLATFDGKRLHQSTSRRMPHSQEAFEQLTGLLHREDRPLSAQQLIPQIAAPALADAAVHARLQRGIARLRRKAKLS